MDADYHAGRTASFRHDHPTMRSCTTTEGAAPHTARRLARTAFLLTVFLCAAAAARASGTERPGAILSAHPLRVVPAAEVEREAVGFFETQHFPGMKYDVESWMISYESRDFDGSPAVVQAQLFIPLVPGGGERPVLVFGSGTTGVADGCAPSLEQPEVHRFGWYTANMLSYAGRGFIVLFPDYIGFNDPSRTQRYFSKLAEAHVMLDGARAARSFLATVVRPVRAGPRVFAAGFSQGGHAAFSAADLRASYAPDVPLAGIIGFGATCDVTALLREGPVYAPFLLYAWSEMYGTSDVDPSRVLKAPWAERLEADAAVMCVDTFQHYYPWDPARLYASDFLEALKNNHIEQVLPRLAARLAENKAGLSGHGIPALVIQGTGDIVVTTPTQDRFVSELRAAGSTVSYLVLNGVRHRFIRQAGFSASVDWMESIAGGSP